MAGIFYKAFNALATVGRVYRFIDFRDPSRRGGQLSGVIYGLLLDGRYGLWGQAYKLYRRGKGHIGFFSLSVFQSAESKWDGFEYWLPADVSQINTER
ncbi:hypothetical protein C1X21_04960 [Pseudomonas sp. FW305-3-2-15-A-LB2]|nr:hypothetical protein C1X17_03305 [Pseudomonas sp. FW305-3-2-15-C-TSA2]PMV32029.1 hypothetical protein C1X22_03270 [Pseudomonas sp. DP16D-L5]PMV41174.1 hypothetical protein C1X21_04960 [Pseudomonas sp. FW305-3-2-15-A-LB2]PMV48197.1 hypothetical protein C1X16_05640 [Pseudomonas sp. FW305-3-2-15-C-R2A1]PMV54654.1 hypothetical protein C1X18_03200 [Pseudomonas sp. FW305-3-2-15-C-LB1]PMV59279.1 hypothetical protein C1X19_03200 [Pseudomonas sp. GW460-4]PMV65926.1 hypothetical protein C1X20_03455 